MVLPAGLASAGKTDAYTEDDLQAAEEVHFGAIIWGLVKSRVFPRYYLKARCSLGPA